MALHENQTLYLKSLRKIETDRGIKDLAVCCVSFANSKGGKLYIGFEDKTHLPLTNQNISEEVHNDAESGFVVTAIMWLWNRQEYLKLKMVRNISLLPYIHP